MLHLAMQPIHHQVRGVADTAFTNVWCVGYSQVAGLKRWHSEPQTGDVTCQPVCIHTGDQVTPNSLVTAPEKPLDLPIFITCQPHSRTVCMLLCIWRWRGMHIAAGWACEQNLVDGVTQMWSDCAGICTGAVEHSTIFNLLCGG